MKHHDDRPVFEYAGEYYDAAPRTLPYTDEDGELRFVVAAGEMVLYYGPHPFVVSADEARPLTRAAREMMEVCRG